MISKFWASALVLATLFAQSSFCASLPLRIITFNIRYAATSLETNEKPWSTRRPLLVNQLSGQAAEASTTVIGLQEVLNNQLIDIKSGLGTQWAHIGVGRDDGATQGEYSPILYRTDILKVLYSEVKWLSPTPDVVSFGWGAGSRRIVTIGVFEHIATGKRFIHANTHLDNVSSQARSEGIKVVVTRIKAVQQTWGPLPVSLTGDFNSAPDGDAYSTLTGLNYLEDLWNLATHVGTNQLTYTGFSQTGISRIDYIWLGPKDTQPYTPQTIEIVGNYVDGVFVSDHRMVVGDVIVI
ncbi:endonuclease/Exonuclease/phosphatase [Diaporthe amygdali]|uniref:endonuclease/Exonuclease/phosphatase n=1 Tax=Phomopsis amygdali TaxID=1214568 RepID=UPI0022FDDFDC|nr:endonuclease/Exonuclease/phosphatase [Diaporthe amygdali]KAJ0121903.1 endonuclease/Exonuclease/phosphatase [Diaporthe amygdali]